MVPVEFIEAWSKWIELGEYRGAIKPGPIDNRAFKKLLLKKTAPANPNSEGFYEVSKPLFMYFQNFFGGGPCIIKTQQLYRDQKPLH